MKTIRLILGLCLALASSALAQSPNTLTFGSIWQAPRADTTTLLVDFWTVKSNTTSLISMYGFNNGSQQFIQLFDSKFGPTVSVSAWDATADTFTAGNHGMATGDPIQVVTNTAGITAGIYYVCVIPLDTSLGTNTLMLFDTKAHALSGTSGGGTGVQDVTGTTHAALFNRIPQHTFAIGAADNYSLIVPGSGMSFGRGFTLAVSTTATKYTAGAKDITAYVTLTRE